VSDASGAAELAARTSYGRPLAYLAARCRDVAAAEDALADAFAAALERWPRVGVPDNPDAWLLVAARRRLTDRARHAGVETAAAATLRLAAEAAECDVERESTFPDERLKLLFVCAHPAIDETARTALMLQVVLGLDAARIASAFLVAPATMSQRLVRAKAKIRDAGIGFEVPPPQDLAERLRPVLEAIYAAYGTGWEDVAGADPRARGLTEEAVWLGRLTVALVPDDPEARGLLALMLHCEARQPARRDAAGGYVPLTRQDVERWSRPMIEEAEGLLAEASRAGRPGRFQLEAAIQSVHAQRAVSGRTDWEAIALLYEGLVRLAPTIGARVAGAAALAEARGAPVGLAALDAIPRDAVLAYQP
jgi:predicted RNA polymerase sigma factor